jgi:hypothetical protein
MTAKCLASLTIVNSMYHYSGLFEKANDKRASSLFMLYRNRLRD